MLEIARQRSGGGGPSDLEVIQSALEWAGVIFVKENGHGPGVKLRK
jgi:hypothetical protein